jgi:hypothetical protein
MKQQKHMLQNRRCEESERAVDSLNSVEWYENNS